MKYFYDTEFIEGKQKRSFLGISLKESKPTIDLISIGIVCEDGREYYAISKDFNLKEAWNRWDGEYHELTSYEKYHQLPRRKKYWIRENVLKSIFRELLYFGYKKAGLALPELQQDKFTYRNFKALVNCFGKSNKEIAEDVFEFVNQDEITIAKAKEYNIPYETKEFYGYYSAYDHVVLCWLFGKMIDLPKEFPMYTIDLIQSWKEFEKSNTIVKLSDGSCHSTNVKHLSKDYPVNNSEHNALEDAKWNFKLYKFLEKIK